jgi:GxxExxY protein
MTSQDTAYAHASLSRRILACAVRVHRRLGPGLLENAYRACLAREMRRDGLCFQQEVAIALEYDGVSIDCAYRADMIVERSVLLELKAVEKLLPIHEAQLLTYLRVSGIRVGLPLNFNGARLKDGIRRFVR